MKSSVWKFVSIFFVNPTFNHTKSSYVLKHLNKFKICYIYTYNHFEISRPDKHKPIKDLHNQRCAYSFCILFLNKIHHIATIYTNIRFIESNK